MLPDWALPLWIICWMFVWASWCLGYIINFLPLPDRKLFRVFVNLKREVHPFLPVGLLVDLVIYPLSGVSNDWWSYLIAAYVLYAWVKDDDDDDRWKRRRKKLADKVAVTGGKLIVVPEGGKA